MSVVLVLALALEVGVVLRIGDTLNLQVAISALLLFANADPAAYAVSRLWETAVGAAVTIVLSPLLLPTNPARAFVRALHGMADSAAAIVVLAADLDADAHNLDDRARALGPHLAAARRAVRLHPVWWRRHARELDDLVEPTALAPEITSLRRSHVADALEFSTRADTRDWWQASAPSRRSILLPLSDAVAAALVGTPSTTDVEKARTAVLVYSEADQTRFRCDHPPPTAQDDHAADRARPAVRPGPAHRSGETRGTGEDDPRRVMRSRGSTRHDDVPCRHPTSSPRPTRPTSGTPPTAGARMCRVSSRLSAA